MSTKKYRATYNKLANNVTVKNRIQWGARHNHGSLNYNEIREPFD